jgi:hypothetical protein
MMGSAAHARGGLGVNNTGLGLVTAAPVRIGGLQGRSGAAASYMIVSRLAGCVAVRAVQATRLAHQQKMCGGLPPLSCAARTHDGGGATSENKGPTIHIIRHVHTPQAAKRTRPRSLSTAQPSPRRAAQWQLTWDIDFACMICCALQRLTCSSKRWPSQGGDTQTTNNTAAANSLGPSTHVSPAAESV